MKPNHKFRIHIANRNGFGETYCFACMIISSCIVMMFISKVGNFQKMIAINKKREYWYEISLNDETIIGYDSRNAKKLILYPEGKKPNEYIESA